MIVALSAGRDAPADLRERLAFDEATQRQILRAPRPGICEMALLCTCHRTEVYATEGAGDAVHAIAGALPALRPSDHDDLRVLRGHKALEHLFRVACGLDSLVVGEPQVLGQVRRALTIAQAEEAAGPVLASAFGHAVRLGRQVRARTGLGTLGRSIGSITAEHLGHRVGALAGRKGVVVGAGEVALDAAQWLAKAGARLVIVNRTVSSAQRVAERVGGRTRPLAELVDALDDADFLVAAVTGGVVVRGEHLPARALPVVDLSVPRGVEAPGRAVDTLETIPGPQGPEVAAAVAEAEALVADELASWVERQASGAAIRVLRSHVDRIVEDEVARAVSGDAFGPQQTERVRALAARVANKILHYPTIELRESDEQSQALILRLFGLEPWTTES